MPHREVMQIHGYDELEAVQLARIRISVATAAVRGTQSGNCECVQVLLQTAALSPVHTALWGLCALVPALAWVRWHGPVVYTIVFLAHCNC